MLRDDKHKPGRTREHLTTNNNYSLSQLDLKWRPEVRP